MAIEDKSDKQILDVLENNFPIKAIEVDFNDLNNLNLIIKTSFQEAYHLIDDFDGKWYFITELNTICNTINVIGLVNLRIAQDGWMHVYWFEINRVMRSQGFTPRIIDYLKRWAAFRHFNGIKLHANSDKSIKLFSKYDFKKERDNSLVMVWKPL